MHLAHRYDINRSGGMSVMANTFENYLGSSVKMTFLLRGLCGPSPTQKRKHFLLQVGYCLQELHRDASEQQVELAWTTFSISTKMRDVKGGNINSRFLGPNCALSPCGCKLGRSGPCSCVKDSADGEWTSKNLKFNIETSNHIFENAQQSLELLPLLPREMLDC